MQQRYASGQPQRTSGDRNQQCFYEQLVHDSPAAGTERQS